MKTTTTTAKASKASRNTPAPKATAKAPKASAKVETKAKQDKAPKVETKPASSIFALVAGTVAKVEHKGLKQAIAYHVAKGNLAKVETGIKLTEQGASLWTKERVLVDPAQFQDVAAWMHKGGKVPANATRFEGAHAPTQANPAIRFPNLIHWGGFTSTLMRQVFAAIWAKA